MVNTKTPIGEIINYLYNNETVIEDKNLFNSIQNIIDLIVLRTSEKGVEQSFLSLKEEVFDIRIQIIRNPSLIEEISKNSSEVLKERIEDQFSQITKHTNLEFAFVNTLNLYEKISGTTLNKFEGDLLNASSNLPNVDYAGFFKLLESLIPSKEVDTIKKFTDASLALDFCFIVADLIFENKLQLKEKEIKKLSASLKNAIEAYGVISSVMGIWEPEEEDETPWIRNIKILISLNESHFISNQHSVDDLKNMWVA